MDLATNIFYYQHQPPSKQLPQDQQLLQIAMVSHRLIGHVVRPLINAMLEKGIVIQIVIAPVVLHAEQIIAEQRHYLEATGEVAQIAALVRLFQISHSKWLKRLPSYTFLIAVIFISLFSPIYSTNDCPTN